MHKLHVRSCGKLVFPGQRMDQKARLELVFVRRLSHRPRHAEDEGARSLRSRCWVAVAMHVGEIIENKTHAPSANTIIAFMRYVWEADNDLDRLISLG